jgi:hypothetical protein
MNYHTISYAVSGGEFLFPLSFIFSLKGERIIKDALILSHRGRGRKENHHTLMFS